MESILAAHGSEQLIPELSPKYFQEQASYVLSREQCTTHCPSVAISPGGVRTAKISIVDGNFIDLKSLHFSFLVRNLAADAQGGGPGLPLRPLSAIPHSFWRRIRISVNGCCVDDVSCLSRCEEQISRFMSTNKRRNMGDAGFGWEILNDDGDQLSKTVRSQKSERVTWRPLSAGFLQASRYVPMMGGVSSGLCIELECADANAAVLSAAGNSTSWQIEQLKCHVDSVQLSSTMTSDIADILIGGESILIPYSTNSCDVIYTQGQNNIDLSLAKSYSRLATVFVSMGREDAATTVMTKEMNNFYLPSTASVVGAGTELESYIQINQKRMPQFNITGPAQHYHRLIQALGVWNSASHSVNIPKWNYGGRPADSQPVPNAALANGNMFVGAFDCETVPHAEATGMLVQGGGTVQIHLKNAGAPTKCYITSHFDCVLEIKHQGAIAYS